MSVPVDVYAELVAYGICTRSIRPDEVTPDRCTKTVIREIDTAGAIGSDDIRCGGASSPDGNSRSAGDVNSPQAVPQRRCSIFRGANIVTLYDEAGFRRNHTVTVPGDNVSRRRRSAAQRRI